jgi:PPM family protein phosphatase
MNWAIRAASATHPGRRRSKNEDCFFVDVSRGIFIVADGMGGHRAGEIASRCATDYVDSFFSHDRLKSIRDNASAIQMAMEEACFGADRQVFEKTAESPEYSGMGCTLLIALISKDALHICHAGDTRAYVTSNGRIVRLTTDHRLVMELVRNGRMTLEEAQRNPYRNQLTQAIGGFGDLHPSYVRSPLFGKERILLCTDGLWEMVSRNVMLRILSDGDTVEDVCDKLIAAANQAGGVDNITAVVIETRRP